MKAPRIFLSGNSLSGISLIALSLAMASAPAQARDADLSLTTNSVKAQINFFGSRDDMQLGAGYTYHEGSLHTGNLDFHAQGRTALGNLPTTAGLGARVIGWNGDRVDGGAMALGGFATVNFPDVRGLSLTAGLHYAPSILSFGDSDDMTSVEARLSYRAIRNADLFAGYRYLNTDLDGSSDLNLDEGAIFGMKIYF